MMRRSGFEQTNQGLWIDKDVEAQLQYTLDWSEWLDTGDTIATVEYDVAARRNDPAPLTTVSTGLDETNKKTYIELSGGQTDKVYIVTAKVTTNTGLIDRRNFRVNVVARSA
jgi:ABC-type taurine transport system ATPase subunit